MTTYEIKSDAASETIEAASRDEACAAFAAGEGLKGRDEASVRSELEAMGGWLNVIEDDARQWEIGQTYWNAMGELFGREEVIASETTKDEATAAAENWLSGLSDRERKGATAWVGQYQVIALDDDGNVGMAESVGSAEPVDA